MGDSVAAWSRYRQGVKEAVWALSKSIDSRFDQMLWGLGKEDALEIVDEHDTKALCETMRAWRGDILDDLVAQHKYECQRAFDEREDW